MAKTTILQLYRNTNPCNDFSAAKAVLETPTIARSVKDGEAIACRYKEGEGANQVVKTALGIYWVDGSNMKCTVLKDAAAMEEDFKKIIDALDVTDSEVDGSVVVKVAQEDGKVSNEKKPLKDIKLVGYVSTGEDGSLQIAATDTVQGALNKIETYIKGLDYTSADGNGYPVITVGQNNGQVTSATGSITAEAVNIKDTGNLITATNVEGALAEIAINVGKNKIVNGDGSITVTEGTTNTDVKVNVKSDDKILSIDASKGGVQSTLSLVKLSSVPSANVRDAYALQGKGGIALGDPIYIYKDSALLDVTLLHAKGTTVPSYNKETKAWTDIAEATEANLALCFAYEDVNGEVKVVAVSVGDFLREAEFKDGLQVVNGEVSVKVKTGEKYLVVNADGIATTGIDSAINTAITDLDSSATSTDGTNVQVKVTQTDGKISAVNVTTDNTVSQTELAAEATARKRVTGIDGDEYAPTADATYTKNARSLREANDKLDSKLAEVAEKVGDKSVEQSIKDSLSDLTVETIGGSGQYIKSVRQTNGKIAAEAETLSASNVSATPVGGGSGTNVQSVLSELNDKITAVGNDTISITAGVGITVATSGKENTISLKLQEDEQFLEVTSAGGLGVKDGAIIDCGTY